MEIINLKKKKKKVLTYGQQKSYSNAKVCYSCKEKFEDKHAKDKKYCKVRDHCYYTGKYRGATHSKSNLKHSVCIYVYIYIYIYIYICKIYINIYKFL